ncbi:hypothetical protein [Caldibacillus thermoamylovorans]|uniref:hypothetical protein n=1 Tax=Caldibacillus thermoamylovorans TaxID=35841 RepID=UPI0022E8AAA0|nr:hypothetical protein [Caldibacillus thermoamylovorans]
MTTRTSFVVKIVQFSLQNDDEIEFRRQNCAVFTSKWRRERVSSSKLCSFHLKMATRIGFVVKIGCFSPQNGDEIEARRQNCAVFTSKWRREQGSSSKLCGFHFKMMTRSSFVVKIVRFSLQNGDEIESRRQKMDFLA